jgi:hypothetical protein
MNARDTELVHAVARQRARRRRAATLEAQAAMPRYRVATIDGALTVQDTDGGGDAEKAGRWVEHAKRWSETDAEVVAGELNGGMPAVVFTWAYPAEVTA